jgi:tetratricopeptide (TPR) repeat protein
VKRLSPKLWTIPVALLLLSAADGIALLRSASAQQTYPANNDQSWSSGVKRGFNKIGNAFTPKSTPKTQGEDDACSLKTEGKPGANLFVAVGRLYMESEKYGDAEQQFQRALKDKRDFLPALLSYAELKERMGRPDDAIELYKRAAGVYPQEASIYNNAGLCFARQGRLDEAVAAINRALQLDPRNTRYRNNIATVLVDQGKTREAFEHLRQSLGEAAAYYNLGYLLNKKGQTQAALQHFTYAVQADPSMDAAQKWVDYLQRETSQARAPQRSAQNMPRSTNNGMQPDGPRDASGYGGVPVDRSESPRRRLPQMPTEEELASSQDVAPMPSPPRRLPPIAAPEPESDGPSLPGISYENNGGRSPQEAPLPPPASNQPTVRPLPRVY